jgi:hypothetical protein
MWRLLALHSWTFSSTISFHPHIAQRVVTQSKRWCCICPSSVCLQYTLKEILSSASNKYPRSQDSPPSAALIRFPLPIPSDSDKKGAKLHAQNCGFGTRKNCSLYGLLPRFTSGNEFGRLSFCTGQFHRVREQPNNH